MHVIMTVLQTITNITMIPIQCTHENFIIDQQVQMITAATVIQKIQISSHVQEITTFI